MEWEEADCLAAYVQATLVVDVTKAVTPEIAVVEKERLKKPLVIVAVATARLSLAQHAVPTVADFFLVLE